MSQVSSGVGLRLGCGCFGQSHQSPPGFQARRTEAVAASSHLGSSKAAPKPCDCLGQQQAHSFSAGCCSLLHAEMTQEQVR